MYAPIAAPPGQVVGICSPALAVARPGAAVVVIRGGDAGCVDDNEPSARFGPFEAPVAIAVAAS